MSHPDGQTNDGTRTRAVRRPQWTPAVTQPFSVSSPPGRASISALPSHRAGRRTPDPPAPRPVPPAPRRHGARRTVAPGRPSARRCSRRSPQRPARRTRRTARDAAPRDSASKPKSARARIQIKHRKPGEIQPRRQHVEQRFAHPVGGRPGAARRHRDPPPARRPGDDAGQLTTTSRSPPSTWAVCETATRSTVPAFGRGDGGFHLHRFDGGDGLARPPRCHRRRCSP